ncbi:MAG TPA: fumarylacetoacetate hydrolase family protein [Myxococcota bacterium]|nr:fumarylacetoacetate hydrolase family protein [Myxococcota bacterium]
MRPLPSVELPSLPVVGSDDRFPVRRVLCIGRNYAAHAREMGASGREAPFHFTKSATALLAADGPVGLPYPPLTADLHHEIELVAALDAGGRDLTPDAALACVWGYALGLDMTRRDLQAAAKDKGRPWAAAKDFDGSAVCGPLVAAEVLGHPTRGPIALTVNGAPRQAGDLDELIWPIPELLAQLSRLMALRPGDLVYTGTPSGVGPVGPGDRLLGTFPGLPDLHVHILPA